ncbi:MAG: type II toxin-antitoxin system VapC family toxin [Chromatiales bacterium]|jgi:predicted nucleic-acid-binding protein|nr:type II toxin-antitoxin system VapC family toxin [Chromatiales bacterium]
MPALDTNVLVRYVVRDDPAQLREAERVISLYEGEREALFIPITVALEFEWVLRSAYEVAKPAVLELFGRLLDSRELRFQEESVLERALYLYRDGNADFADCLHIASALSVGEDPLLTFDRRAAKLPYAQHISGA